MRFLLDTHLLLWLIGKPQRVPSNIRAELQSCDATVSYSIVSLWEIAIKNSFGRLSFNAETVFDHAERSGFQRLEIEPAHVFAVARLPWHHRDPFDRLLVGQSVTEPITLLTCDGQLGSYGATVRVIEA